MKYMTAEILARYQSDDDPASLQAFEEWEQAGDRYRTELNGTRDKLPGEAVELVDRFNLHDARVLWVGLVENSLVFVLMLEGDGGGLQLEYDLARPPAPTAHPEIAEDCPLEWLYDELSLADKEPGARGVHSILFTDGSELRLAFKALRWRHFPKSMFVGAPTAVGRPLGRRMTARICGGNRGDTATFRIPTARILNVPNPVQSCSARRLPWRILALWRFCTCAFVQRRS